MRPLVPVRPRAALGSVLLLAIQGLQASCGAFGTVRDAAPATALGNGPRVVWDMGHRPLPEIPIPNDIATHPDPNSPTGLRINASQIAPTRFESTLRQQYDELDGWGTYQPITIPMDAEIDHADLLRRMQRDGYRFPDDAVYLVDLETGIPLPLDVGGGNFVYTLKERDNYFPNDPRVNGSNLLLGDVDEDVNRNGVMDPGEDTNFDGLLNRASVFPAGTDPVDHLSTWWDADTHTLILRPLLPMKERHRYAVLVTSRLGNANGPVRAPFDTVVHPAQAAHLAGLDAQLRARPDYYGGLVYQRRTSDPQGGDRVTFAFTFTTGTTVSDLLDLHEGLYGQGPFRALGAQVPPEFKLVQANRSSIDGGCSQAQRDRPYILRGDQLRSLFAALSAGEGHPAATARRLQDLSHYIDYVVFATYRTPFLMGDPKSDDLQDHWQINGRTGEIQHLGADTVQVVITVPKPLNGARAPFPVTIAGHGYSSYFLEALSYAGNMAMQGVATIGINGPSHGLGFSAGDLETYRAVFDTQCMLGAADIITTDRTKDSNGDGEPDLAADFWTSYIFHTRDQVRQFALDNMQLIRALRSFGPGNFSGQDYNGDGNAMNDLAGDWNGDGRPDIGTADGRFYYFGESLGGIMAMVLGSAEKYIRASVPISGGAGMTDIGIRSSQPGVPEAVVLRMMSPFVLGIPADDASLAPFVGPSADSCRTARGDNARYECSRRGATHTACRPGQVSLRFMMPDGAEQGNLEFACVDLDPASRNARPGFPATDPDAPRALVMQPGDDVVVMNRTSGQSRCAQVQAGGRLRIAVPSAVDDQLELIVYRGAMIPDYGTCTPREGAVERGRIQTWQVVEGDCTWQCGHVPFYDLPNRTKHFRRWSDRSAWLTSPAEGLGLRRQTPELRRFFMLAQAVLEPADPINWAPLYFLRRPEGHAQHGVLNFNTAGDMNVPINTGNAFSRAAGLIPFFGPGAPPEYVDYAAPQPLFDRYATTPNDVLIDRHVLEGINTLGRWPTAQCGPNCLFDVDDLDEGAQGFGEATLSPRLRLVRVGRTASTAADLNAVWSPPGTYDAAGPVVSGTLNFYVRTRGYHSIETPRPERSASWPWDTPTYNLNILGRYFATDARDIYYVTHPSTHRCMEGVSCPEFPAQPAD